MSVIFKVHKFYKKLYGNSKYFIKVIWKQNVLIKKKSIHVYLQYSRIQSMKNTYVHGQKLDKYNKRKITAIKDYIQFVKYFSPLFKN